jgi:hypothetical protein
MAKRVKLTEASGNEIALRSNKVDINLLTSLSEVTLTAKGTAQSPGPVFIQKATLADLLHDLQALKKELKRHGVRTQYTAHHSEGASFKQAIDRIIKDSDVPAKQKRVKLKV